MATQDLSTSMSVDSRTDAGTFKRWLKNIPDKARLTVSVTKGDRPFDGDESRITARWTQSVDDN